ncbi:hypothetical protein D3C75_1137830 [compost metagenome]
MRGEAFFHREIRRVAHIGGVGVATGTVGHALFTGLTGLLVGQYLTHLIALFTFFQIVSGRHRLEHFGHLQQ